jgi:hypothetical protein
MESPCKTDKEDPKREQRQRADKKICYECRDKNNKCVKREKVRRERYKEIGFCQIDAASVFADFKI